MSYDFTIDDALKNGFDSGLLYALRYHDSVCRLTDLDISKLAEHLESMKPWRTCGEWETLIHKNITRWRRMEDTDEC